MTLLLWGRCVQPPGLAAVLQQSQHPCPSGAEGHDHKCVPSFPESGLLLCQVVALEDVFIFYKVETFCVASCQICPT